MPSLISQNQKQHKKAIPIILRKFVLALVEAFESLTNSTSLDADVLSDRFKLARFKEGVTETLWDVLMPNGMDMV